MRRLIFVKKKRARCYNSRTQILSIAAKKQFNNEIYTLEVCVSMSVSGI